MFVDSCFLMFTPVVSLFRWTKHMQDSRRTFYPKKEMFKHTLFTVHPAKKHNHKHRNIHVWWMNPTVSLVHIYV